MSYIEFNKSNLTNLEFALQREVLLTAKNSGYLSSTIIGCNTRKYHGLLIAPLQEKEYKRYVLLSSLDESIEYQDQLFNLSIHQYPQAYYPTGHKYLNKVVYDKYWHLEYQIGEILFHKEVLLSKYESKVFIRYTVEYAPGTFSLRLKPFLAFREINQLMTANFLVNKKYQLIDAGISMKPYDDLPTIYMQMNKKHRYIASPDWYYHIEYEEEKKRGYAYKEDLYVPGYFELQLKQGDQFVLSVSLSQEDSLALSSFFVEEENHMHQRNSFQTCLDSAAKQFLVHSFDGYNIIAGYPWFGIWGRDSFIALPGLTLCSQRNIELFKKIILTNTYQIKTGLIPNVGKDTTAQFNSVDASLWYIWSIQQYVIKTSDRIWVKTELIDSIENILNHYRSGINSAIKMHENGLIWAKETGKAFTWMDAVVDGVPVTQRGGYAVEINALWYNAIGFYREFITDKQQDKEWEELQIRIKKSFRDLFWSDEKGYLADYIDEDGANWDLRPNQVIACALPYLILEKEQCTQILTRSRKELLTNKGLRTLSPKHEKYKGYYEGNHQERDNAYHQGTVWPWLLQFYCEGQYKLYGERYNYFANDILIEFEEDMFINGLGTINEIYDGNPPFCGKGAISQAWSVAALLYIKELWIEYNDLI